MAESSTTSLADTEAHLARAETDLSAQGLNLAFGLTLISLVASIAFFAFGNQVAGVALVSLPVVMLIRSFITRG